MTTHVSDRAGYGTTPSHDGKSSVETGWACWNVLTGESLLKVKVEAGQLCIVAATNPNRAIWSLVLRRKSGELLDVTGISGQNPTELEKTARDVGAAPTLQLQTSTGSVDLDLLKVLEAARAQREFIDVP